MFLACVQGQVDARNLNLPGNFFQRPAGVVTCLFWQGGGLLISGTARLTSIKIYQNTAASVRTSPCTLPTCGTHESQARMPDAQGAGIYTTGSSALVHCVLQDNSATGEVRTAPPPNTGMTH